METSPDVETQWAQRVAERTGTADRSARSVEGGQHAVSSGPHQAAPEPLYLGPHQLVVGQEQFLPATVTQPG